MKRKINARKTKKSDVESFFGLKKTMTKKIKLPGKFTNQKDLRFSVSLVILIAFLSFSAMLFLFSLIGDQSAKAIGKKYSFQEGAGGSVSRKSSPVISNILNDANLDFQLTIPSTWTGWIYKTGFVKSPADDSISDQYLQVFLPVQGKTSSNFDEKQRKMLTILKFTAKEWTKLETGCGKGDVSYCDAMGKKITEKDGDVYAYITEPECPKTFEARCHEIDKVLESFQLK